MQLVEEMCSWLSTLLMIYACLQHILGFAKGLLNRLYPISITIGTELIWRTKMKENISNQQNCFPSMCLLMPFDQNCVVDIVQERILYYIPGTKIGVIQTVSLF